MDGSVIWGLGGIGFLTLVNVVVVAYNAGRIKERIDNLSRRINRLENILNNRRD